MIDRRPLVFVVDDQEANVRLLERLLDQADLADTRGFADAHAALAAVNADVPDLILLDLHMPRLDGFGFLSALGARLAEDDFLPVLVVTADVDRETRRRALHAGASDFVTKPIDADEVVARCRNLLRTRRLHRLLRQRNLDLSGELDERTSALEQARRERDSIISALSPHEPDETPEATALRVCSELVRVGNVDAAAIVHLMPDGQAAALASVGLRFEVTSDVRVLPESRTRHLRGQAQSGPWVEERIAADEDHAYRAQLVLAGAVSAVYAPVRIAGEVVGVVVGMTSQVRTADELVDRLPAVVEYAAVAAALIGPRLAAVNDASLSRREIEAVIEHRRLRSVFQPIVSLTGSANVGFEALTRFDDGTPPDRRFGEAERVGMGTALELACLSEALSAADRLPTDRWLSVNITPGVVLASDGLRRLVAGVRRPLVLELTEHAPVDDYHQLRTAISRLGSDIRMAIDDAGAGFASLRHVLELRPDFVKLDIGMVRGIDRDPARQALLAGMQYFATRTKSTLIAEGIETADERRTLTQLGVTLGQGYLLGRPAEVEAWAARETAARPGQTSRRNIRIPTVARTRG